MNNNATIKHLFFFVTLAGVFGAGPGFTQEDEVFSYPSGVVHGSVSRLDTRGSGSSTEEVYSSSLAGFFNDDPQADLAVLKGDQVQMFLNPAMWSAVVQVPAQVLAMAALPSPGESFKHELLVTTSSGLRAFTRNTPQRNFTSRTVGRDIAWRNATVLGVGDLDGQHGDEIFGARAQGDLGLILFSNGGASSETEFVFPLVEPAIDMVACDFDGSGVKDLVVLGESGLSVYSIGGVLLNSVPGERGDGITVIGNAFDDKEKVVWVAPGLAGALDFVHVLSDQGTLLPESLGDVDPVGIAAGDLDGDGDEDLVVSHKSSYSLMILENRDGVFRRSSGQTLFTDREEPNAQLNESVPLVYDFDHDDDLDIAVAVQSTHHIYLYSNGLESEDLLKPRLATPVKFNVNQVGFTQLGILQITAFDSGDIPDGATHVEILGYYKTDLLSSTESELRSEFHFQFDVSYTRYETGPIVIEDPGPGVFFWLQRYVKIGTSGAYARVYPAAVYGFTVEHGTMPQGPILIWLRRNAFANVHSSTEADESMFDGSSGSSFVRSVSTIVQLTPLPAFELGEEPGSGQSEE